MRRAVILCGTASFVMAFLGGILAFSLVAPSLVAAQENRIRADSFTVQDASGADRVRMQQGPGELATVQIVGLNGQNRLGLVYGGPTGENPASVGVRFYNPEHLSRGFLGVLDTPPTNQDAILQLQDDQGRIRLLLAVSPEGEPSIRMLDADGNVTWSAP